MHEDFIFVVDWLPSSKWLFINKQYMAQNLLMSQFCSEAVKRDKSLCKKFCGVIEHDESTIVL